MAHLETWYRCPVCYKPFRSLGEAVACRNDHLPESEQWAIGKGGKAIRIYENYHPDSLHGINGALMEADLSDIIAVRKMQLSERNSET